MGDFLKIISELSDEQRELLLLRLSKFRGARTADPRAGAPPRLGTASEPPAPFGRADSRGVAAPGEGQPESDADTQSTLVPLQLQGAGRALFCVHPVGGGVSCFYHLARLLGVDRPVYGLRARGLGEGEEPRDSIGQMADDYLQLMRRAQPRGPYLLAGYSFGGHVAFEIAQRLRTQGEGVALLSLIDTWVLPADERPQEEVDETSALWYLLTDTLRLSPERLKEAEVGKGADHVWRHLHENGLLQPGFGEAEFRSYVNLFKAHLTALRRYEHRRYNGKVILFRAEARPEGPGERLRWRELSDEVDIHVVPGTHHSILSEPNVGLLAGKLKEYLDEAASA